MFSDIEILAFRRASPVRRTSQTCQQACLASPERCWSFVYHPVGRGGGGLEGQCFAVVSPGFNPSYDPATVSGVVAWPCRDDTDCSLNGKCTAGACACRPAWKGLK